jgi:DUF1009 family protein
MATIGLIAGGGRFPLLFAESARRAGHRVVAAAHVNQTDPALEKLVDGCTWVKLGQFGKVFEVLKAAGCTQVVMLGSIAKARFFRDAWLDALGVQIMARLAVKSDDSVLRAIAGALEERGLPVTDPAAVMGRREPTQDQWADARYGLELARAIGRLDLGQTVVVKDGMAVAVEALEGTDACIRRGGQLAKDGGVVVKAVKPQQDRRFDLPAVGPDTVDSMREAGCQVLAVEAGSTLVMDLDEMVRRADKAKIALVGIR